MHSVIAAATNHPSAVAPQRGLFNERICRSMVDEGLSVEVLSPRPFAPPVGPFSSYGDLPRSEPWDGYTVHRPPFLYLLPKRVFYGRSGESYAKRVPAYVDANLEVPDVVHACHVYMDGYGMLPYCRAHDVPLFSVVHGTLLNTFESLPGDVRGKVAETLRESAGVCCVSEALTEKARSLDGVDPTRVHTVPIGADPARFPTDRESELRERFGIGPDETVVLFVGQYLEAKGIEEIRRTLRALDLPNVRFVFVGHGGDLRGAVEETLRKNGYDAEHVYWRLPPDDVAEWFAVADLLILPSHSEGRPTVVYEAMASGTAVLASTVGGVPEQVADGETGRLVPPRDAGAFGEALESMVADRESLREMGRRGRERLEREGWTWSGHAKRVRELHEAAL
jgi:hypothetical protein